MIRKTLLLLFSTVAVLVIIVAVYVYNNIDLLARQQAERIASQTLGVKVAIDDLKISMQERTITAGGIRIANPRGYDRPAAMTVGHVTIQAENLGRGLLVFDEIRLEDVDVYFEVKENGINLAEIRDNVTKNRRQAEREPGQTPKVIINELFINNAQLIPSSTLVKEELEPATVPDIYLRDIGRDENGVLAHQAIALVWNELFRTFAKQAGQAGFLQGITTERLKKIGLSHYEILKNTVKEGMESIDMQKIGDEFKNLFEE